MLWLSNSYNNQSQFYICAEQPLSHSPEGGIFGASVWLCDLGNIGIQYPASDWPERQWLFCKVYDLIIDIHWLDECQVIFVSTVWPSRVSSDVPMLGYPAYPFEYECKT